MYWCYCCKERIELLIDNRCVNCNSQAIEEIDNHSSDNPSQYQPYIIPRQNQSRDQRMRTEENSTHGTHEEDNSTHNIQTRRIPSMFHFIVISNIQNQLKNGLTNEEIEKLPKVVCLQQECAVCQEKGCNGIELPCKHEFHQKCIIPWLNQTNSCPCCRATIQI